MSGQDAVPGKDGGLGAGALGGVQLGPELVIQGGLGDFKVGSVAQQGELQEVVGIDIEIQLQEVAHPASGIVDRALVRRTEEAGGLKGGAIEIVPCPLGMAAKFDGGVVAQGLPGAESDRALIVHGKAGLGDHVKDAPEAVAVFSREATGHHVHGLDHIRRQAGREHRVGVFPEGNPVDKDIQSQLAAAHVDKVIVAADHARHGDGNHLGEVGPLRGGKQVEVALLDGGGTGGKSGSNGLGFRGHRHGLGYGKQFELQGKVPDLARLQREEQALLQEVGTTHNQRIFAGRKPPECEVPVGPRSRLARKGDADALQTHLGIWQRRLVGLGMNHPMHRAIPLCEPVPGGRQYSENKNNDD